MKSTLLGIFINFALALTKCSAGLLGHSFALVADGLESSAEFHLGAKSADARGKPSGKQTFGLLRRRHVRVERISYIGRESNLLEEMQAGLIHSPESVYTEYPDPSRDE